MKAVVCSGYGSMEKIKILAVSKPVLRPGEILIRVAAASVQTSDWRIQSMEMPAGMATLARLALGVRRPRRVILGAEVSGIVEATGSDVTEFEPGDQVVAALAPRFGGHAEFVAVPAKGAVVRKPETVDFPEAACAAFGGMTALHFLKCKAHVTAGESVLVRGASGAVGHACIQIARILGGNVTAICSSSNKSFVQRLGARRTFDYRSTDLAQMSGQFDVVVDVFGDLTAQEGLKLLKPEGRLILLSAGMADMVKGLIHNRVSSRTILTGMAPDTRKRLSELMTLIERGVYRPVIDKVYRMDQIREAYHHVASRSKKGSVVIIPDNTLALD